MKNFSKIFFKIFIVCAMTSTPFFALAATFSLVNTPLNWRATAAGTAIVSVWGGGGGGGAGYKYGDHNASGYGGGGGGYAEKQLSVNPGDIVGIIIGAGGNGGVMNPNSVGNTSARGGGASSIYFINLSTPLFTAGGGGGGASGIQNSQGLDGTPGGGPGGGVAGLYNGGSVYAVGGGGGIGVGGDVNLYGGAGGKFAANSNPRSSGGGGGAGWGIPGSGELNNDGYYGQGVSSILVYGANGGMGGNAGWEGSKGCTGSCAGGGGTDTAGSAPGGGGGGSDVGYGASGGDGYASIIFTATNYAPTGSLDSADCGAFNGWTYDPDSSGTSIQVKFYDGPESSGTLLGQTTANGPRPDVDQVMGVSGNHGFSFTTPGSVKDGAAHTIYAYGVDTAGGADGELGNSGTTVKCSQAVQNNPPSAPVISGATSGTQNQTMNFSVVSNSNPSSDNISYFVDWDGNGNFQPTSGAYSSGQSAPISKAWSSVGSYTFYVKAEDTVNGLFSGASSYTVSIGAGNQNLPSGVSVNISTNATSVNAGEGVTFSSTATQGSASLTNHGIESSSDGTNWQNIGASNPPANPTDNLSVAQYFSNIGTYYARAYAKASGDSGYTYSSQISVLVTPALDGCTSSCNGGDNNPPNNPPGNNPSPGFTLSGPTSASVQFLAGAGATTQTSTLEVNPTGGFNSQVNISFQSTTCQNVTGYSFDGSSFSQSPSTNMTDDGSNNYRAPSNNIGLNVQIQFSSSFSGSCNVIFNGTGGGASSTFDLPVNASGFNPVFQEI